MPYSEHGVGGQRASEPDPPQAPFYLHTASRALLSMTEQVSPDDPSFARAITRIEGRIATATAPSRRLIARDCCNAPRAATRQTGTRLSLTYPAALCQGLILCAFG